MFGSPSASISLADHAFKPATPLPVTSPAVAMCRTSSTGVIVIEAVSDMMLNGDVPPVAEASTPEVPLGLASVMSHAR